MLFRESTFGCFTLTDEESASGVAVGEQLPLCILSTQFTKIPAAGKNQEWIKLHTYHINYNIIYGLKFFQMFLMFTGQILTRSLLMNALET